MRAIAKSAKGLGAVQGGNENPCASTALTQPAKTRPRAKTVQSVEASREPDQIEEMQAMIRKSHDKHFDEIRATAKKRFDEELKNLCQRRDRSSIAR
jgi:hypothetical protein